MSVELHLPDLPEVPIAIGARAGAAPHPRRPWHLALRDVISAYLPLLLMALLALGTWWLVKNTPGAPPARQAGPVRQEPDYTMSRFVLERFAPDGRLRVRIEGNELRHYPANDRIEVDRVQIQGFDDRGRETLASASRAVANGAGTELQLQGGAEVTGTDADGAPVRIRSEFLHARLDTHIVRTHLPVTVQVGTSELTAGGLLYDRDRRVLDLGAPIRARLTPPGRR